MREVVFPLLCWVQGLSLLRESFIFLFHHISQENFLKTKVPKGFFGTSQVGQLPPAPACYQPQFRSTLLIFFWISYYLPQSQHLPLTFPQISTFKISFLTLKDGRTSTHTPTKDLATHLYLLMRSHATHTHTQSIKFSTSTLVLATCHLHDKLYFPSSYTSPTSSVDWAHYISTPMELSSPTFFSIDSNFEV